MHSHQLVLAAVLPEGRSSYCRAVGCGSGEGEGVGNAECPAEREEDTSGDWAARGTCNNTGWRAII